MLEESASAIPSSIWDSMNSWFTPTVLFILLNLMIAIIAFTSTLGNQQNQKKSQNDPSKPNIAKPPSVLQRLKSINFHTHFRSQEPQNPYTHHEPTPDENLDTQSHYFFPEVENLETPNQTQARYVLEQAHENNPQKNQARFDFAEKDSKPDDFQRGREEELVEQKSREQSMGEVCGRMSDSHFGRTKSETDPTSGEIPARMRKSASLKSAFVRLEEIVEARRPATVREKGNAKATDCDEEVDAKADDFINRFKQQLKLQRLDSVIRYKEMKGRGSGGEQM